MRRIYLLSLVMILGTACGGDDNTSNNNNNDMGTVDTSFEETDSASGLNSAARERLCTEIIGEVGDPGSTISCTPDIVVPSASACADQVGDFPACATVENVRTCVEAQLTCGSDVDESDACYFLNYDACELPIRTTPLQDLTSGEAALTCGLLLDSAGGSGNSIDCGGLSVVVPSQAQCVAALNEGAECTDLLTFQECFAAPLACNEPDREQCWFLYGNDDQCTPPYQGEERLPVGFFVFPPQPTTCDDPTAIQRVPFTFVSTDVFPIVPGDLVNGLSMIPGVTLGADTVSARRSRISNLGETECTSDADCSGDFRCATSGVPGAKRFCTVQTGVEFVPGTFRADFDPGVFEEQKQLVGILIENTALLEGRLPTSVGELFGPTGEKDLFVNAARATDPSRTYRESTKDFLRGIASVTDPANTLTSIWTFAGDLPVRARPLIEPEELEDHWTNDASVGEALIDALPDPVPREGNLYQSMIQMIQKDYALEKYQNHEKFLFIFTDGPNEVFDSAATYAGVLAAVESLDIHVFIVHLDTGVDPTLIRDLPHYYLGNQACQDDPACTKAACASDSDCLNFETCRQVNVYPAEATGSVTQTTSQYCMPNYNAEGRLGPINEFADLACRSGGNYMYISNPDEMRDYWRNLPFVVNGQFSMDADFSALSNPGVTDGFYLLSGTFLGTLGNGDIAHTLTSPDNDVAIDSREIIRIGTP